MHVKRRLSGLPLVGACTGLYLFINRPLALSGPVIRRFTLSLRSNCSVLQLPAYQDAG